MKKLYYIFLMWAALGLMVACDEVSVNDRLIYVEPPQVSRAVLISIV